MIQRPGSAKKHLSAPYTAAKRLKIPAAEGRNTVSRSKYGAAKSVAIITGSGK